MIVDDGKAAEIRAALRRPRVPRQIRKREASSMAFVKTFVVHPERGVPDSYIKNFLLEAEKKGPIRVATTTLRTPTGILLNVIATQIDTWESMGIDPPADVQAKIAEQARLSSVANDD